VRCTYSINLISSQQRNNSIHHDADRWTNPVPRNKMLLSCMIGPLTQGNCLTRTPICCIVDPASRFVIGASSTLLNWSVRKTGALSLEAADTWYALWPLTGCHCRWVSLLLAFVRFWFQVWAPTCRLSWQMFVVYSAFPGICRNWTSHCATNSLPYA
jgi:hypothetical protein